MKTKQSISIAIMAAACLLSGWAQAEEIVFLPQKAERGPGVVLYQGKFLQFKDRDSRAAWDFNVAKEADYYLYYRQNRGDKSILNVMLDGEELLKKETKGPGSYFGTYRMREEKIHLTKGKHTLSLGPDASNKRAAGTIWSLRLTEKKKTTDMANSLYYEKKATFAETIVHLRSTHPELSYQQYLFPIDKKLWRDFPHQMAWLGQDLVDEEEGRNNPRIQILDTMTKYFQHDRDNKLELGLLDRVMKELPDKKLSRSFMRTIAEAPPSDPRAMELYEHLCRERRQQRLEPLRERTDKIIFAKRSVFAMNSGIYNITEYEGIYGSGPTGLYTVELDTETNDSFARTTTLFSPKNSMVRDPNLSFDAKHLLFAWRKTRRDFKNFDAPEKDNYQIYEMDLATKELKQLTTDETYGANYQPCYTPDGNIIFNSSRIVQHITCGWGDHSNLFLMNKEGKYQRRIGFDQVSSEFPTVLNNGTVLHLRRDYNDRGQTGAHSLIVMNPDGTGQTEYYGNQTGTPNSFQHARAIPGSDKIACVLSGYHNTQGGQLAIIDIRKGRNHGKGVTQIPQMTEPPSSQRPDDNYLKYQIQYSDPFPLSETEFIVSRSDTWSATPNRRHPAHYGLYFMTADNRRELLAYDPDISCLQAVPVMKRKQPAVRPSLVDYNKDTGMFYVQNVYLGAAAKGIKPGTVKKIRIVELLYKHYTTRTGSAAGPGGAWNTVTSPAHPLALFDAKKILGTATVYEDGSAMFEAPARAPLYFQLLDEKNRAVQTMRSWTTLMPNERFSCVGCHEDKNDTPVVNARTIAMTKGIEKITPFYGPARGFSFMTEVQPIFDKHCISCHKKGGKAEKLELTAEPFHDVELEGRSWANSYVKIMAARPGPDPSKFTIRSGPPEWLRQGPAMADEPNRYVQYWGRLGTMGPVAPYSAGAIASGMIKKLEKGHAKVKLSQEEWDKLVTWIDLNLPYCGDYMEANIWTDEEIAHYQSRIAERQRNEAIDAENIKQYISDGQP